MAAHCSGCMFTVCVCSLLCVCTWDKCRAQIPCHMSRHFHFTMNNTIVFNSAVKVNVLTQIHFNGTNFFNARLTQRVRLFSVWPVAQPVVGEMEMHSVANLATLQTLLAIFFPSKKHPNLVSENHRYCRASARSCSPSARTHLSLALSLCVCSVSL